jgi:serine/threonine protein phosphatase PrpC
MSPDQLGKAERKADAEQQDAQRTQAADLQVHFGGYSCAGIKAENQDAFAAKTPEAAALKAKGAIAAIADGVSSASHAAQAAQLSVTQFINDYYATAPTWSTNKSAATVLTSLNSWLYAQGGLLSNQSSQWLTTFSAIILKSATGYIFHVGDTRISKYCQQQLETITTDHNQKQGANHNILTRALGADARLQVDVHQVTLQAGDLYLLTSDGVHEHISPKALKQLLNRLPAAALSKDLENLSQSIVEQAIVSGSDDNVSCLLCYISQVASRKVEEIERDLLNKVIPPPLKTGQCLDGFRVKKILHESVRSHLYLVQREHDQQLLVLKAPSLNMSDDVIYLQGFRREAWVGQCINHVNVMTIKSGSQGSRFLYHIGEYIQGQTLSQWMFDHPKPDIAQVRDIIKQVINALRALQRLELVHRDLKPDNIMIDQYGRVKLIDYGTVFIASIDENQETLALTVPQGTVNYIAPETLLKMQTDHQSDLFSLGVICYEMLTGQQPYKPMQRAEIKFDDYSQWHYRSIKQFRPDLPVWLDISLAQATRADPLSRYPAFSAFFADLNKPNIEAVAAYKKQPLLQRNPVMFWKGTSFVLFVSLLLSWFG